MFDLLEGAAGDAPGFGGTVAGDTARVAFREYGLAEVHSALAIAAFHASGEWKHLGHRSAASALINELNLDPVSTKRHAAFGRKLMKMPLTTAALLAGEITVAHAKKMTICLRRDLVAAFEGPDGEAFLVSKAAEMVFEDFRKVLFHWIDINQGDDEQEKAEKRRATCDVRTASDFDGTTHLEGKLPALVGEEFAKELKRLEDIEFKKDWAAALAEHGPKFGLDDMARTSMERRVDALAQMVRRSAAYDGDPAGPRFVVNLLIDQETIDIEINQRFGDKSLTRTNPMRTCQTLGGTPLTPSDVLDAMLAGRVRRVVRNTNGTISDAGHATALFSPKELNDVTEISGITENGILERIRDRVFTAKSEQLNHGRNNRLFEGIQRLAIQIQHPRCTHKHGCLIPSVDCEIDHTIDWQDLGQTDFKNGKPLCRRHNLFKQNTRNRRLVTGRHRK